MALSGHKLTRPQTPKGPAMTTDTHTIIDDEELYRLFLEQAEAAGGFNNLSGLADEPYRDSVEIRLSTVPGRYSVTLYVLVGRYAYYDSWSGAAEYEEDIVRVKVKWVPDEGSFFSVIPWGAIRRDRQRTEESIRRYVECGLPDLATRRLGRYHKQWPTRAAHLAEELDIRVLPS